MALTLHPVPGKAKAKMLCEAFAAGAPRDAIGHVFYGVTDGNLSAWRHVQALGLDYWFIDNSYFDKTRGVQFRVTKNRTQYGGAIVSDCKRFDAMGIDIVPLHPFEFDDSEVRVLAVEQSALFMTLVARNEGWLEMKLRQYNTNRVRRRPWGPDKMTLQTTLQQDLDRSNIVVTHSSAAAVAAVLSALPVDVSKESAAHPFSRLANWPDRRLWAGALADNQFTIDEMKDGTAWRMLHK